MKMLHLLKELEAIFECSGYYFTQTALIFSSVYSSSNISDPKEKFKHMSQKKAQGEKSLFSGKVSKDSKTYLLMISLSQENSK